MSLYDAQEQINKTSETKPQQSIITYGITDFKRQKYQEWEAFIK